MSAVENRGNGREIKAQSSTNRETVSERVKNILEKVQQMSSEEYTVRHRAMSISTGGYIADREITLNSALSKVENTATLLHELAHGVLGHQADRNELPKQQKEFEAETVTALLCSDFGIDRNSTIYLKCWEATEELIEDIKIIDRAYKQIKEALEE